MAKSGSQGISGTGLLAIAGGGVLLWSAVKGRRWTEVVRELLTGDQPGVGTDYPIVVPERSQDATGVDGGTSGGSSGAGWDKAEASSYWGVMTASGKRMTPTTIASPYFPLGTVLQIEYKGKVVSGTVWDFGPADWVMAANPDRFIDLAEPMMKELTGRASNVVKVNYRVLTWGTGRQYRPNSAMAKKLERQWK